MEACDTRVGSGADTAPITVGGSGRVCVLDVESAIAEDVMVYLPANDSPTVRRSSLLRLTAVAALRFKVTPDGLADVDLSSVSDGAEEDDMVMCAEEALRWLGDAGTLVTHNGVAHDVPLIARRAMRTWMFEQAPSVLAWGRRPGERHFDTSLSLGTGSLVDLCAGLGIPAVVPRRGRSAVADERTRKCEVDVAATAVAYLHARAGEMGSSVWLASAWRDLARVLLRRPSRDHLLPLVRRGIELGDDLAAARR